MVEIDVVAEGASYRVTVTDGGSSTHLVTVAPSDLERLAEGRSVEALIEASFRFLLDREPKESILSDFDIAVIGRYFREYEREIAERIRS